MMTRRILAAAMLALAISGAHARSSVPLIEPPRIALIGADGQPLDAERVHAAIVRGADSRHWKIRADEPGKVTLSYDKEGKHEVVVAVSFDAGGYQIRYVSSIGMKYKQEATGAEIHPFYNKWVDTLSGDIEAAARGK